MSASLYPASPQNVPENLTEAKSSYKRQAWLAMMGLVGFMVIYLALLAGFAFITYKAGMGMGGFNIVNMILFLCSGILTLFMLKSLFAMRKMGDPNGIEVTDSEQPELYAFLHRLADEIGAPKPHRVFITSQVNAAVFYDLSLLNLIFPSKKNLIIGLGLVNVLTLSELKAVLAHEFGHFAQNSMVVGRWVYVAQQIIAHMVSVRDWLDSVVRFISSIDLRIAWIGWILSLILWSLRSLMDTLFKIVIIAERALSREMEFNADLVAVSVTGSDALINALYKLKAADEALRTAMKVAGQAAGNEEIIDDLFQAQSETITEMSRILDDKDYGQPQAATGANKENHRVFENEMARPPQMWSTHPPSSDREANAKFVYVEAAEDNRSAWLLFAEADKLRRSLSLDIYNAEKTKNFKVASPAEAVAKNFSSISYSPEYRGAYLGRSPVRDFASVAQIFEMANVSGDVNVDALYPETINTDLKAVRNLESEVDTLKALLSGELKPSGGVIRHRGDDLHMNEIPDVIDDVQHEKGEALKKLMQHEADCRATYMQIAESYQKGWPEYLRNTLELLHCSDHMLATVQNEQSLLVNTWQVITADGKIGHFEKKRILKVCVNVNKVMREVSQNLGQLEFSDKINKELGIESWAKATPIFDFAPVTNKNFPQWCQEASNTMTHFENALSTLHNIFLEDLLESEAMLKTHFKKGTQPAPSPASGKCAQDYPTLLSGEEYVLQKKLDIWNRFQLAQGLVPSLLRTAVAVTVVGGTIYAGLFGVT